MTTNQAIIAISWIKRQISIPKIGMRWKRKKNRNKPSQKLDHKRRESELLRYGCPCFQKVRIIPPMKQALTNATYDHWNFQVSPGVPRNKPAGDHHCQMARLPNHVVNVDQACVMCGVRVTIWCRERDLNPHPITGLGPQPSAYANSAIAARRCSDYLTEYTRCNWVCRATTYVRFLE
jgi:hypothetical protein